MFRRNLLYTSLGEASSKAFILVIFIYLAKSLGPLNYGYFSLAITFYLMGRTISHNSLDMHGIRLISHLSSRAEINRVVSRINSIRLLFVLSVSTVLSGAVLVLYHEPKMRLICIGFLFCLAASTFISEWFFIGLQRMFYSAAAQALLWGLFLILVLIAPKIGSTYQYYLPAALLVSIAAVATVMQMLIWKFTGRYRFSFEFAELKTLFFETGYINIVNIFGYLVNSVGIFILSFSSDSADLGYYAVATQICSMLILAGSLIYRVSLPHLNTVYHASEEEFVHRLEFTTKFLGFAAVSMAFILIAYSRPFVMLLWGKEYSSVVLILAVLSPIVFFGYYMMGFFQGLFILGRDKMLMKIYAFQLFTTSVSTLAGFKYYGLIGVTAALTASYFIGFIVFLVCFHIARPFEYQHAVKELLAGALMITGVYWFFDGSVSFVFALIFPAAYFAVCVLLKVISLADLRIIFSKGYAETVADPINRVG